MSAAVSPFDELNQHWLAVRIYYEDTDFTGMVYHANYLRFFERGRSEFLRDAGVSHQSLLSRPDPAAFTLTNVNVDYKRAARIDDQLQIRSRYTGTKGVRVLFEQTALRGEEIIAEAVPCWPSSETYPLSNSGHIYFPARERAGAPSV